MFRFAHISDLHLTPLPSLTRAEINAKRILGHLSWQRKRKHHHTIEATNALKTDLRTQKPDHIAVTGDMTNLGTETEFIAASHWLYDFEKPDGISLVPGNHDAYGKRFEQHIETYWSDFMTGPFPFMRKINKVAFIGLSTAVETAPFFANGMVSDNQCDALAMLLENAKKQGLTRIVMMHHPPGPGRTGKRKALWNTNKLHEVLKDKGAEMILHGHTHKPKTYDLFGIPVIDSGCASYASKDENHRGQYNIIEISAKKDIVIHHRFYNAEKNAYEGDGTKGTTL